MCEDSKSEHTSIDDFKGHIKLHSTFDNERCNSKHGSKQQLEPHTHIEHKAESFMCEYCNIECKKNMNLTNI